MAKMNYLRPLLDSLNEEQLREIMESYAKQDRSFEAFIIERSGKAVETGKTYAEFHAELMKLLNKCSSRKYGFIKVTRLKKAGLESYQQLLNSHFKNENFETALWMSLALIEMLHEAILKNTRYSWANKPYKTFEKSLAECMDQFDTCMTMVKIQRKDRPQVFTALIECWWNERQRHFSQHYFELDDVFRYVERDADVIEMKNTIEHLMKLSGRSMPVEKPQQGVSRFLSAVFSFNDNPSDKILSVALKDLDHRVQQQLDQWD